MTLPTIVTVKATITDGSGPVSGRLSWHRTVSVLPASPTDPVYLIPEVVETTVGSDGVVEQPLYSCNDPVASPTSFTWTVYPHFPHWKTPFSIVVPYDAAGAEVNLSQLAPVPTSDGALYALAAHTHSGGGGGGDVVSVFGRTGAVTAQSGDYSANQITSGTFAIGRIPTGTTSTTVPLGNDSRFSDARTPTAHASSHQDGGADELALDASQVTTGTLAIGRVPTGTSGTTVALGNAAAGLISTHEAAADPHTGYRRTYYETAGTYAVVTGARDFIGPDDPATEGFTLVNGDKWYEV